MTRRLGRAWAIGVIVMTVAAAGSHGLAAAHAQPQADLSSIKPVLEAHCLKCHSGEKPKGDFKLDTLGDDFTDEAVRDQWLTVLKRVQSGEMPPKGKPRPSESDVQRLAGWIHARDAATESARRAVFGRVVTRRLNRVEYENTVRDLLGVEVQVKDLLPVDSSANGFDNNGGALHMSSFLMERYLEAADKALNMAIANTPAPRSGKKRYDYRDDSRISTGSNRKFFRFVDDAVVFFSSTYSPTTLWGFYPPEGGRYRFRISTYGFQSEGKPVTYRVEAGNMLMGGSRHLVNYFDAAAGEPTIAEFVEQLEPHNTIYIVPYGTGTEHDVTRAGGGEKYSGAGLAVQWVEIEGPLNDTWPPVSHRRLFGDLQQKPVAGGRLEVVSDDPMADATRILQAFARRAFRRPVTDEDVQPFVELAKEKLGEGDSFEHAVRVALTGVLVSPKFLFLREPVKRAGAAQADGDRGAPVLDDFALASRLSYFLWSTMPDEALLALAEQGKLRDAATLRAQVDRMLDHPKAHALTENFVGQWLGLRDIDFTRPDYLLYPEYDDMLKASMLKETYLFFEEMLKHDLSVANFIDSDFSMLNARLARHYGIPGVDGWTFQKVALPPDSHRGGLMTMASVLKVTANGTNTSPVVRGAWVLGRLLGEPPPPPPAGVPAIEPDIRGATTIRQQLAKHRQVESCASCHVKIDPPGFALESYDVIGGWRDNYRVLGNGKPVTIDGKRMHYNEGPKVDCADVLPDGRRFADIDELKKLLLADKDRLARAMTKTLLTYATGQAPAPADQPEIERIVKEIAGKNYGLRSLVHQVVASELFRSK